MTPLRCWWFGCKAHPQDPTPIEYRQCMRCHSFLDYESMSGYTRYRRTMAWFNYWFYRAWFPMRCPDCGKRYGKHERCLPF